MTRTCFATALVFVAASFVAQSAHADVQKDGPEAWPGKIMLGVDPFGVQVDYGVDPYNAFAAAGYASYKLDINVAGLIASTQQLSIWLGGEFNVGGRADLAIIEPGIFVRLTLEKLMKIPLVPMIEAGLSGPIYLPYDYGEHAVAGGFEIKVGGGIYYFLTRNIGLGVTTHFTFGPEIYSNTETGGRVTGFGGYWDFGTGLRFAL